MLWGSCGGVLGVLVGDIWGDWGGAGRGVYRDSFGCGRRGLRRRWGR